jgi:hypothetical protein
MDYSALIDGPDIGRADGVTTETRIEGLIYLPFVRFAEIPSSNPGALRQFGLANH